MAVKAIGEGLTDCCGIGEYLSRIGAEACGGCGAAFCWVEVYLRVCDCQWNVLVTLLQSMKSLARVGSLTSLLAPIDQVFLHTTSVRRLPSRCVTCVSHQQWKLTAEGREQMTIQTAAASPCGHTTQVDNDCKHAIERERFSRCPVSPRVPKVQTNRT